MKTLKEFYLLKKCSSQSNPLQKLRISNLISEEIINDLNQANTRYFIHEKEKESIFVFLQNDISVFRNVLNECAIRHQLAM